MLRRIAGFVAAFVLASAVTGIVGGIAEAQKTNRAETNTVVSSNMSDGNAQIVTGAAGATGNISSTTLGQGIAPPGGGGGFGNIAILDNNAKVVNSGVARAITGQNTATGNDSTNITGSFQVDTDGPVLIIPILGLGPGGP